jgi:hypothetical protein
MARQRMEGPMTFTDRVLQTLPIWAGYSYGDSVDIPEVPWYTPPSRTATGTRQINCVTLTWPILALLYPGADPSPAQYLTHVIGKHDDGRAVDPWGGPSVARALGIVDEDYRPHLDGWWLVQRWRSPFTFYRGHSYMVEVRGELCRVLEATDAAGGHVGLRDWREHPARVLEPSGHESRAVRLRGSLP